MDFGAFGFEPPASTSTAADAFYIPDPMDCRTCNLCTSQCPTFKVEGRFEASPQGRLKLIRRVLNGGEALDAEEIANLNDCVECRACEKVCPSRMHFQQLLERTRDRLPAVIHPLSVRALRALTRRHDRLLAAVAVLRFYQHSGLAGLLKKLGVLKRIGAERLNGMVPKLGPRAALAGLYPASGEKRGAVALFKGCFTDALQNHTLQAAVTLLTRLGYDVHVPRHQQCCGAIHAHNGDRQGVDALAARNLPAFASLNVDAILYTATACGPSLREYERQEGAGTEAFVTRLMEINQFIAELNWPEPLTLKPSHAPVLVHEPCSQQFPDPSNKSPYQALARIPGLRMEPLPENHVCCGAGGTYMLSHAQMSDRIRADKLRHLDGVQAGVLLTSNVGCALHLAAGIREAGIDVEVTHPVAFLARQLEL